MRLESTVSNEKSSIIVNVPLIILVPEIVGIRLLFLNTSLSVGDVTAAILMREFSLLSIPKPLSLVTIKIEGP